MKCGELSTRQRMVQATCELLEEQGYHATGLSEILQRSDTPRGSLYYYFPEGKEELAIEAIEQQGRLIESRLREAIAASDDAAEAIGGLFCRLAHAASTSGARALSPLAVVALESSSTNERLRQTCAAIYEDWRALFEVKLLTCGFAPEHAASLSLMILGSMEGAMMLTKTLRSGDPLHQTGQHLAHLIKLMQPSTP